MKNHPVAIALTYIDFAILSFLLVIVVMTAEFSNEVTLNTCLAGIALSLAATATGFWLLYKNSDKEPTLDQTKASGFVWLGILAWLANFGALQFLYLLFTAPYNH